MVFCQVYLSSYPYFEAFELLLEAVKFTNSSKMLKDEKLDDQIFEPQEKLDITGQTELLYAQRPIWLPNSSIKLYQLFPQDLLAQMRVKLDILKDLLQSESQYATVEAKNGTFYKFDI